MIALRVDTELYEDMVAEMEKSGLSMSEVARRRILAGSTTTITQEFFEPVLELAEDVELPLRRVSRQDQRPRYRPAPMSYATGSTVTAGRRE